MSMTREEAIKRLEEIQFNTHTFEDEKAMEIAIRAVRPVSREQVEKGKWIDAYDDFSTAKCNKCGELFDVSDTGENLNVLFDAFKKYYRFCPACGTPMTDEAVDIVMERLEALKDGSTTD